MAKHKNRTGALVTCFTCKAAGPGHTAAVCMTNDPSIAEVFVCHCSTCQPACQREACQPHNIKTGRRRKQPPTCTHCFAEHAGECA